MHLHYNWRGVPNFGDRLGMFFLYQLDETPAWRPPDKAELVTIGSILEHLPRNWEGTVCGAGLLRPESRLDLSRANVLALRGEYTAQRVKTSQKPVLGDPGLLVPRFIAQPTAKYDLGIVPHWSDTQLAKRFPYGKIINPRDHPEVVVKQIASCKRIISSSLHGLIVADAYGIPRQAELFANAHKEGGDFKYFDYMTVFGTHPHFGEMWKAPHAVVERVQRELWDALMTALGHPTVGDVEPIERGWSICPRRPKVSFLVPFRDDGEHRSRVWAWLRKYWHHHFPDAEIIMGRDNGTPFSKSRAVNHAAERAKGRIFVIMDADAYMDPWALKGVINTILDALSEGRRMWAMPYSHLYRLNREITLDILATDPRGPYLGPPEPCWIEPSKLNPAYGHRYGAMMQVMPREAYFMAGGWEPRMCGWGSEDAAAMRALDTLYAPHEVFEGDILHLFHAKVGTTAKDRKWVGQRTTEPNARLGQRYGSATGDRGWMRALINERYRPRSNDPFLRLLDWWRM